jgi:hypothetical protein
LSANDFDTVILKNQPIANAGVLKYSDGNKLKKWEDLKDNIGMVVPIINEHPGDDNGMEGLFSGKEKIWGLGKIKQCPKGSESLCADMYFINGAPIKDGYSIGFPYQPVSEVGEFKGVKYDEIQSKLKINHIALTDNPRNPKALQMMGDSKLALVDGQVQWVKGADSVKPGVINITKVAVDSIRFRFDSRLEEIAKKLKTDNPEIGDAELNDRSRVMYLNQSRLKGNDTMVKPLVETETDAGEPTKPMDKTNPEEPAKKDCAKKDTGDESDSDRIVIPPVNGDSLTHDQMIAELARLRAENHANDALTRKVSEIERREKSAKDAAEKFKKLYEEEMSKSIKVKIDSLVKDHGFDAKSFNGVHPEFINGALFSAQLLSKGPSTGDSVAGEVKADATDLDVNDFRWDWKEQKMVPIKKGER